MREVYVVGGELEQKIGNWQKFICWWRIIM